MNKMLLPTDVVGGSFWLLSMAMIGATIFFLLERNRVSRRWNTTMTLLGVVMLVSAIHYYYTKQMWVSTGTAPIILRYLDWVLTQPMQVVLFYVVLSAVTQVSTALFWRLLIGTLVMVIGEFLGAAGYMSATLGFLIGLVGWLYILGELYMGEAGRVNAKSGNDATQPGVQWPEIDPDYRMGNLSTRLFYRAPGWRRRHQQPQYNLQPG